MAVLGKKPDQRQPALKVRLVGENEERRAEARAILLKMGDPPVEIVESGLTLPAPGELNGNGNGNGNGHKPAPARVPVGKSVEEDRVRIARMKGYEGDPCGECGQLTLIRSGTCCKCDTCGASSGCS